MLGCPSPKKSFKSSDNAHHIVGDPGEVSCVVRKGAESFQARVEEPLGSDFYQTISERSGECWLLIGLKKCFVLLCPIGEQQRLSWVVFVFSNTTAIVSPYLSGSLTKVVHARETVIFFFPNQKRRNYRWFEKTFQMLSAGPFQRVFINAKHLREWKANKNVQVAWSRCIQDLWFWYNKFEIWVSSFSLMNVSMLFSQRKKNIFRENAH